MRIAIDTNVIVSHLKDDPFAEGTRNFLRWTRTTQQSLVMSEVVYAELYAGIALSSNPRLEEKRVQRLLAVNDVEVYLSGTLDIAKRAGQMYAKYLSERGVSRSGIIPDFLIGAHAESYGDIFVTWNPRDFREYLSIPALTPTKIIEKYR